MSEKRLLKIQSGVAGEYLVAAEITRRGHVASLTLKNTQGIDVLASSQDGAKTVAIQVKCNQGKTAEWMLGPKAENASARSLFYVFVRLHDGGAPDFHIVPSKVVARQVTESHRAWLARPDRKGNPHKDNTIRIFRDDRGRYHNRWELLGLD